MSKESHTSPRVFPRMMSIKEAAAQLGMTPYEVWLLVDDGEIPGVHTEAPRKDGRPRTIWLHPRDVAAKILTEERIAKWAKVDEENQVCRRLFVMFGTEYARRMTAMMVDATGHGCPCTWGGSCLFGKPLPSPRARRLAEQAAEVAS